MRPRSGSCEIDQDTGEVLGIRSLLETVPLRQQRRTFLLDYQADPYVRVGFCVSPVFFNRTARFLQTGLQRTGDLACPEVSTISPTK